MSKRGEGRGRAGTRALALLATSPNPVVLRVLADGPTGLPALQSRGGAPGSTLRARLKCLVATDVVVANNDPGLPRGSATYELTASGQDLLEVVEIVERWLVESPNAGQPFGGNCAKAAIGALAEGWSATLLRALAARPLSVADLDSLIATINYPSLERRVAAMRHAGQVEACTTAGRETPYAVTDWLRRGVAPLLAAIRWERLHLSESSPPVGPIDIEAAFLLAMPLLEPEAGLSGVCRLAVEVPAAGEERVAGVLAGVEGGSVESCTSRLDGAADAWASGSLGAWLRALIDRDDGSLEFGGDGHLARNLIAGLHKALFAPMRSGGEAALA